MFSRKIALVSILSVMASMAFSNSATIVNDTTKKISVIYQLVYDKDFSTPIYGATIGVTVTRSLMVPLTINGYRESGIIINSVNGTTVEAHSGKKASATCFCLTRHNNPQYCTVDLKQDAKGKWQCYL